MAIQFNPSQNLTNYVQELQRVGQKGQFQVKPKLPEPKAPTALSGFQGLTWAPGPTGGVTGASGAVSGRLSALRRAIRSKESGNDYGAINPHSGALGAYQIMPFNLFGGNSSNWDQQALGRNVSRSEFLNNKSIQDAIATWQLGNYLKKYGPAGAAVAWYGGPGAVANMHDKSPQANGYPSLYAYWQDVLSRMR